MLFMNYTCAIISVNKLKLKLNTYGRMYITFES